MASKEIGVLTLINFISRLLQFCNKFRNSNITEKNNSPNFFLLVQRWHMKIWSTSKNEWLGCSSSVDFWIHNSFFTFFRKKSHKFWEKIRKTGPQCNQLESKHEWSLYLVILVECTGSFRNCSTVIDGKSKDQTHFKSITIELFWACFQYQGFMMIW